MNMVINSWELAQMCVTDVPIPLLSLEVSHLFSSVVDFALLLDQ